MSSTQTFPKFLTLPYPILGEIIPVYTSTKIMTFGELGVMGKLQN